MSPAGPAQSTVVDDEQLVIYQGLDLALRIGEVVLASGAGAADATASMVAVTNAVGLAGCDVDVTFTTISVSYQPAPNTPPETRMRRVDHRELDYSKLTDIDHLVRDLVEGTADQEEARKRLGVILSTGRPLPRWASSVGWGAMAAGAATLIGGGWLVILVAFAATVAIDWANRQLARRRIPTFYQQVLGGFVATVAAVGMRALVSDSDSSQVIAAGIIVLLAGISFVGAVQDALTGFYVTAAARSFEVILLTGGIIVGVTGGLAIADRFDLELVIDPYNVRGLGYLPTAIAGASLTAAAFVFACYAPLRAIVPAALMGALGQVVFRIVVEARFGVAWASAMAAIVIGVAAFSVAGRMRVPPLVVVVSGIVPLLPGMSIYRGLFLMFDSNFAGITSLATAATISVALAAGVLLGEYVAQPLKREARRLETRLAGPRLVGPLRLKRPRRTRRRVASDDLARE